MKYVCEKCGSDDIQIRQWVNPNNDQLHEWCEGESYRECFCENCKDLSTWKLKIEK